MQEQLLTAGEFAKLARTTKRTVLWYAEKGILLPCKIDDSGYRFYKPQQIIDFQSVLLMRKLGLSIAEITTMLTGGQQLQQLFERQRGLIKQQIGQLERMLSDTTRYYHNLDASGTLVLPKLKQVKSFDMYVLTKEGPYARIKDYTAEFQNMFVHLPSGSVRLTAFMRSAYLPAKAQMKIGVICEPGLQLKPGLTVNRETVPAYTALSYMHQGSTTLLSLLWQELGRYCRKQHFVLDTSLPFANVEFYRPDTSAYPDPEDSLLTELHMPVRTDKP